MKGIDPALDVLIGWLWVSPAPALLERYGVRHLARVRWLSQITVREELRGRGYGQALLEARHERLAAEDVEALYLRVYDWNTAAPRVYTRCAYELVRQFVTDAHLRKDLTPTPLRQGQVPRPGCRARYQSGSGVLRANSSFESSATHIMDQRHRHILIAGSLGSWVEWWDPAVGRVVAPRQRPDTRRSA